MDENRTSQLLGSVYTQMSLASMNDPSKETGRMMSDLNTQVLTSDGFKPLSKEERDKAARIAAESGFSFDGYQVVRREFFSHKFDLEDQGPRSSWGVKHADSPAF